MISRLSFANNHPLEYLSSICLVTLSAFLFAGCTLFAGNQKAEIRYAETAQSENIWPDGLKKRFSRYWWERFEGAAEDVLHIEAPYVKEMVDKELYTNYIGNTLRNELVYVEVHNIQWETPHLVTVKSTVHFEVPSGQVKKTYYEDRWVLAGEHWYHVLYDPIIFKNL